VVRRYANALRKGCRLLIDQPNREYLLRHFVAVGNIGAFRKNVITKNRWNPRRQRFESDWLLERGSKKQHNWMSIRLYTRNQIQSLLESAGLVIEKLYGSSSGEPYYRGSKRLIVVGRK
jgi:hypothetical protein